MLDWHDEGLHEWVRLSLPLIIGVSLVTADNWIIAHFASNTSGAISLMTYAKRLFTAPMSMLAQAAGAASMPFFASLWAKEQRFEFASAVADSVSRVTCMGLLAASGMMALGKPLIDLLFVGGRFSTADARECAAYFAVFSVSLFLWSAQSIYSRAFYAAGNTFAPMVAGTIITLISLPVYARFFSRLRRHGTRVRVRPGNRLANADYRFSTASAAHGVAGESGLSRDGAMRGGGAYGRGDHVDRIFVDGGRTVSEDERGRAPALDRLGRAGGGWTALGRDYAMGADEDGFGAAQGDDAAAAAGLNSSEGLLSQTQKRKGTGLRGTI